MKNQLLTTKQIAEFLQVDVETVRRYVRSGQLKSIKLGGRYIRVKPKDLKKFVKKKEK